MRLAVLVSGTGSILESILEQGLPVVVVLADRPCRGLELAAGAGVATELVDRSTFGGFGPGFDREGYTDELVARLVHHRVELLAMAGFGTILGPAIHRAFRDRILNTHPSLLPEFKGWHAVRDALAAGVTETGCTVHLAGVDVDTGPVLAQEAVPVAPTDDEASLHERIKAVERRLYPETIDAVIEALDAGTEPSRLAVAREARGRQEAGR